MRTVYISIVVMYHLPFCRTPAILIVTLLLVLYPRHNSRTQMPTMPKFRMKVPHLRCDLRTSFKVKWSKVKVTRPVNADTHPRPYLLNANLTHTAGCCCWGNVWRMSRPFPCQFAPNSHAVL